MKIAVVGSRTLGSLFLVERALRLSGFDVSEILTGDARGVDRAAATYATREGIPCRVFPANWRQHGKQAGAIRNAALVEAADAVVAIWDGRSPGTRLTLEMARRKGRPSYIMKTDLVSS